LSSTLIRTIEDIEHDIRAQEAVLESAKHRLYALQTERSTLATKLANEAGHPWLGKAVKRTFPSSRDMRRPATAAERAAKPSQLYVYERVPSTRTERGVVRLGTGAWMRRGYQPRAGEFYVTSASGATSYRLGAMAPGEDGKTIYRWELDE
jgi:hypothetical protein